MCSVSPGFKGGGGGIEHLEAVCAMAYTLLCSFYNYPVLHEHGKKGSAAPPFLPLGKTLM